MPSKPAEQAMPRVIYKCMRLTTSFYGTVNREYYFDVKIFSDNMACAKIKRTKYMCDINDSVVQGRLSENF